MSAHVFTAGQTRYAFDEETGEVRCTAPGCAYTAAPAGPSLRGPAILRMVSHQAHARLLEEGAEVIQRPVDRALLDGHSRGVAYPDRDRTEVLLHGHLDALHRAAAMDRARPAPAAVPVWPRGVAAGLLVVGAFLLAVLSGHGVRALDLPTGWYVLVNLLAGGTGGVLSVLAVRAVGVSVRVGTGYRYPRRIRPRRGR